MAALLDPRFRALSFLNSDVREEIHLDILNSIEFSIIAEGNPDVKQEIEVPVEVIPKVTTNQNQTKQAPNIHIKPENDSVPLLPNV